ncbi:MAG: ABC transporter ATP-binding protein [Pseudomonadota bacterium]
MGLRLQTISHRFGDTLAVADASLEVAAGEIVCLFGPSGCGKTTLLRIAAGLEPLQSGSVSVENNVLAEPGREVPAEKRPIGFVFQDYVLFPHKSVRQNLSFARPGVGKDEIAEQLASVGLEGYERRFPHELSGGEQQRVALARALIRKPQALLLDEPFASIDMVRRRALREDLRTLLKARGAAVVIVTHDPEEALALGDRVALMRRGRIIETASPESLFAAPATPQGAAIFPDSQSIEGRVAGDVFQSAIGELYAKGAHPGPATVVLRAGAISITPDKEGAFTAIDCRFSGPDWIVYFSDAQRTIQLMAKVTKPIDVGARLAFSVDESGFFVFSNAAV